MLGGSQGTQNMTPMANVCTNWRPEGCVERKLWVSLVWVSLNCSGNCSRSFGGNMNMWNNAFQCHMNVTFPLLLHTLCLSSGISQCGMSVLLLPVLLTGQQQLLPTVGYSGEGGSTLFPRPSTPQTASVKVLHHVAKFSFAFQDGENNILEQKNRTPPSVWVWFLSGWNKKWQIRNSIPYCRTELSCSVSYKLQAAQAEIESLSHFLAAWCLGSENLWSMLESNTTKMGKVQPAAVLQDVEDI